MPALRTNIRNVPLISLPATARALGLKHSILIGTLLSSGIEIHRTNPRAQGRLTIEQTERLAQLLAKSGGRR